MHSALRPVNVRRQSLNCLEVMLRITGLLQTAITAAVQTAISVQYEVLGVLLS